MYKLAPKDINTVLEAQNLVGEAKQKAHANSDAGSRYS